MGWYQSHISVNFLSAMPPHFLPPTLTQPDILKGTFVQLQLHCNCGHYSALGFSPQAYYHGLTLDKTECWKMVKVICLILLQKMQTTLSKRRKMAEWETERERRDGGGKEGRKEEKFCHKSRQGGRVREKDRRKTGDIEDRKCAMRKGFGHYMT